MSDFIEYIKDLERRIELLERSAPEATISSTTSWGLITGNIEDQDDLGALAGLDNVDTSSIENDAVTFEKMQNISTGKMLGRVTSESGAVEELSPTSVRSMIASPIASGFAKITVSDTEPSEPSVGDIWIDTST